MYIGNNSNNTTGIPLQMFDPSLYAGVSVPLVSVGPPVGDADGLASAPGVVLVADRDEGVRRVDVPAGTSSVFIPGLGINGTGSPIAYRPNDGHVFVGFGATVPGVAGDNRIDEFDAIGSFVQTHTTVAEVETMTFDPASGLIYYATFSPEVRSFAPLTGIDLAIGNSSGVIDGGLVLDPRTGLLYVGTANGVNSGLVETIDPSTGETRLFASGFDGSLGILREPVSGDLYFLESNELYRIEAEFIPEPGSGSLIAVGLAALLTCRCRRCKLQILS
nr:PEP-CTERM motif [uncultured bacterium]